QRKEYNLILDLCRVACEPTHSNDNFKLHPPWRIKFPNAPPRSRTSSDSFEGCRASVTLARRSAKSQIANSKFQTEQCHVEFGSWILEFSRESRRQDSHLHPLVYETIASYSATPSCAAH